MNEKPRHGEPCNGCGYCCEEVLCPLGNAVVAMDDGPCPALEPEAGKRVCGLVKHPERYAPVLAHVHGVERLSEAASLLIGANIGCDAQLNGEPRNQTFVSRMFLRASITRHLVNAAANVWGLRL